MHVNGSAIEAHLWCVDLDIQVDCGQLMARLPQDEQDRASAFVFERDRRRFVVARTALRSVLSGRVGVPAEDLEFDYAFRRKPSLARWCRAEDLRFNLSHSQGLALVALTYGHEIGVDVEQIRQVPDTNALVAQEFSAAERTVFEALPAALRNDAFLRGWVRKEAFIKATGEGLYRRLSEVEVTIAPHHGARLLAVGGDTSISAHWSMIALSPHPGFVGAVVAQAPSLDLVVHGFHRWAAQIGIGEGAPLSAPGH